MKKSQYIAACLLSQIGLAIVGLFFILASIIMGGDISFAKAASNVIIFPFIWMLSLLIISLPITILYGLPIAIILEKKGYLNFINLVIASLIPATLIWLAGYRKPELLYINAVAVSSCFWLVAYSPFMKTKFWDKGSNN